jgi:outer membrane biosynthesis protein TonB
MNRKRGGLITMFVISIAIHILFGGAWSAYRLHKIHNTAVPSPQIFAVLTPTSTAQITPPQLASAASTKDSVLMPTQITPSKAKDLAPSANLQKNVLSTLTTKKPNELNAVTPTATSAPMGPFQSEIDPKKAWINVAESVNYNLLRGISMDISGGEYRLPDELDVRVRAKGDLTIEYPLIPAAMGKEAVIYVLLLIDEEGKKVRVQIVRGDPDFDSPVLQALEKVEFRSAILKHKPVRSLLLLEFEFRRNPPEIGSF